MPDRIHITSLTCHLPLGLGPSAFDLLPGPPCPVVLDISIDLDDSVVPLCVATDDMAGLGVNYSTLSKTIYAALTFSTPPHPPPSFASPAALLKRVGEIVLASTDAVRGAHVQLTLPRGLLHASSVDYAQRFEQRKEGGAVQCTIRDLKVACVVGLHPHERAERQRLEADIAVTGMVQSWSHKAFADEALTWLERSSFGTLESLVDTFGKHLLSLPSLSSPASIVDITIRKPSALPFATPSIRVQRSAFDFARRSKLLATSTLGAPATASSSRGVSTSAVAGSAVREGKRVFIAVGSNIGDRVGHIRRAVKELQQAGCRLKDTSRLYESEPMYVTDQDRFVNGVIEIETTLAPLDLLRLLKRTERSVGRVKTFTNGPRVIDLDLVLYGEDEVVLGSREDAEDEDGVRWLECPHPSIAEREFVLRPLADIAPDLIHPTRKTTISDLLLRLSTTSPSTLHPIIPFPSPSLPLSLSSPPHPSTPHIMAIFNATPDSFSDGDASRTITSSALSSCLALASLPSPPPIIDIGGMSTRPHSVPCTEEEELSRVVPLVQAIRASSDPVSASILSIDTYRPSVARAAIEAGASCINDVRGGSEPGMLQTMADLDVPVILMHSRGDSKTMTLTETQDYSPFGGVVNGIRAELEASVRAALEAGVKRWDIIVDPGLGFAKSFTDNLVLLKRLPEVFTPSSPSTSGTEGAAETAPRVDLSQFPVLVGASRKGFVGTVSGRKVPSERGYADAALNAMCVASGVVDVLRVHDPQAAADAVKMAVAIRDA